MWSWVLYGSLLLGASYVLLNSRRSKWTAHGKHVFITGGSQGLGLALAKLLASRGAHVVICSRSESKLRSALKDVESCRQYESQHLSYISADVSNLSTVSLAIQKCSMPVDTVFCCAGAAHPGLFLNHTEEEFDKGIRLIYKTALCTAHAAAAYMKQNQIPGKIIFTGSFLSFMGMFGYSQYSPMKYAIRGLAECLRSELQMYGIQVHMYFPATILSPGLEEENKTKPALTLEIEGQDEGLSPEACAQHLLRGVESHEFSITDGIIGLCLRVSSGGCAPGNRLLFDSILMVPARWVLLAWRRFVADRTVRKHSFHK